MPRSGEATRRRILEAAYDLFYRDGFARVGVDTIAAASGVTKRTLYYHFDSKDKLLAEVLELQHELAMQRIARWVQRGGDDPLRVVETLFADLAKWAGKARWQGSGFTRMAMELAGQPGHPARAAASQHKQAVEDCLADRFAALGLASPRRLARQIKLLSEGCMSLMVIHGDRSYAETAGEAAKLLVALHQAASAKGRKRKITAA